MEYKKLPLWKMTMKQEGRMDHIVYFAALYLTTAIEAGWTIHPGYEAERAEKVGELHVEVKPE